jgi:hypothetical protein
MVVLVDALVEPSFTGFQRETEENRLFPTPLCDNGESGPKILENIRARREGNVPLGERARRGFV